MLNLVIIGLNAEKLTATFKTTSKVGIFAVKEDYYWVRIPDSKDHKDLELGQTMEVPEQALNKIIGE